MDEFHSRRWPLELSAFEFQSSKLLEFQGRMITQARGEKRWWQASSQLSISESLRLQPLMEATLEGLLSKVEGAKPSSINIDLNLQASPLLEHSTLKHWFTPLPVLEEIVPQALVNHPTLTIDSIPILERSIRPSNVQSSNLELRLGPMPYHFTHNSKYKHF